MKNYEKLDIVLKHLREGNLLQYGAETNHTTLQSIKYNP